MRDNPLQFAVVREDPRLELELIARGGLRRVLLIGSGGCTALSLRTLRPEVEVTLVDFNPAQLGHVEAKLAALALPQAARLERFNVGSSSPAGLNACGNFEALFRGLRGLLDDLVFDPGEVERAFFEPGALPELVSRWVASRYWPVAFELFFSDALLDAMFGPAATQHAPRGSYPGYFRAAFERGLGRVDAFDNYFLHHVLLGRYIDRAAALPAYVRGLHDARPFEMIQGQLGDVPRLERFDLISLSNIADWMNEAERAELCDALDAAAPGALALVRQLNNHTDLGPELGPRWQPLDALGDTLLAADRSLFYDRVRVYQKAP